jgi:hypothetical protein
VQAWVLDFTETGRPTMMMTHAGKDVRCEGSLWVVPQDGTVVRTRVRLRGFADEKTGIPEPLRPGPAGGAVSPSGYLPAPQSPVQTSNDWIESLADVEVTYHRDPAVGVWVPARMSEVYEGALPRSGNKPSLFGRATCVAEYRNYKRFETSAKIVAPK